MISRKFAYADDLALLHSSGNWKDLEGNLSQDMSTLSVFFKVWLEEPLSNFEQPLIFFLLFLSVLIFVYTIVEADFERPLDNFERPFRFLKTP